MGLCEFVYYKGTQSVKKIFSPSSCKRPREDEPPGPVNFNVVKRTNFMAVHVTFTSVYPKHYIIFFRVVSTLEEKEKLKGQINYQ